MNTGELKVNFEFDMKLLIQKEKERRTSEPDDTLYSLSVLVGKVGKLNDVVREAMLTHDKYKDSELHEMPPHRKAHYRSHFIQRLREIQAVALVWTASLEEEAASEMLGASLADEVLVQAGLNNPTYPEIEDSY